MIRPRVVELANSGVGCTCEAGAEVDRSRGLGVVAFPAEPQIPTSLCILLVQLWFATILRNSIAVDVKSRHCARAPAQRRVAENQRPSGSWTSRFGLLCSTDGAVAKGHCSQQGSAYHQNQHGSAAETRHTVFTS